MNQNVLRELPRDPGERKQVPLATGVLDYFPAALAEVARVSKAGNDQHNPGEPLRWARGKSADHADCLIRHLIQRGTWDIVYDEDGNEIMRMRHTAKVAWRALALLQEELEAEAGFDPGEVESDAELVYNVSPKESYWWGSPTEIISGPSKQGELEAAYRESQEGEGWGKHCDGVYVKDECPDSITLQKQFEVGYDTSADGSKLEIELPPWTPRKDIVEEERRQGVEEAMRKAQQSETSPVSKGY